MLADVAAAAEDDRSAAAAAAAGAEEGSTAGEGSSKQMEGVCVTPAATPAATPVKTRSGAAPSAPVITEREKQQYIDEHGTTSAAFMKQLKGGRYKSDYRWLWYDFIARMSYDSVRGALRRVGKAFNLPDWLQEKLVPSKSTLAGAVVEMNALADVMVAEAISNAQSRTLSFDGSNVGVKDHQGIQAHLDGRAYQLGLQQKYSKTGEHGAEAIMSRMQDINATVDFVKERGVSVEVTQEVHPILFAGTQGGSMTDHAQNETKTVDVLEVECRKWCEKNIPDWNEKTREEQDDMVFFSRGYCFQHKCDNLAKAIKTAMKLYRLKSGCLQSKQKKELYFSSAVTWCWCAHKCIGMASSAATDLNLNADFKLWLRGKGRKDDLTMLCSLGPLVGDRFWAVLKNGACLFRLRHSIIEFLQAL